jgi:hypothetical protein
MSEVNPSAETQPIRCSHTFRCSYCHTHFSFIAEPDSKPRCSACKGKGYGIPFPVGER